MLTQQTQYEKEQYEKELLVAVKKNWTSIIDMVPPIPEKVQLAALEQDPTSIRYIVNPTEEAQLVAVKQNPDLIQYIRKPTEEAQLVAVKQNPELIWYIQHPTKKAQLFAVELVKKNPSLIKRFDRPIEEIQLAALEQDPTSIRYIVNPTEKAQLVAVKGNPYSIKYIIDPTEEAQLVAVEKKSDSIMYIVNPTEKAQLTVVKNDPDLIKHIVDPTEKVQMAVVKNDPDLLQYINYPTKEAQLVAVEKKSDSIKYIVNPTEKAQLTVVENDPDLIKYIGDPTEKVQMAVVKNDPNLLQYINYPTEEAQLVAVEHNPELIQYIKHPAEKVQLVAVEHNPELIQYIKHPSEKVQLVAVEHNPELIQYIDNPTKNTQLTVVKNDPNLIQYIVNPTEEAQLVAVKKNPNLINFINYPTKKTQLAAMKFKNQQPKNINELIFASDIYLNHLSEKSRNLVKDYTGLGYRHMNTVLRSKKKQECKYDLSLLNQIIVNGPIYAKKIVLWRSFDPTFTSGKKLKEKLDKLSKGDVFEEQAFLSTTYDDNPNSTFYDTKAGCCQMKINVPAGIHMLALENFSESEELKKEKEILLTPGMGLIFKNVYNKDNKKIYEFNLLKDRYSTTIPPTHFIDVPLKLKDIPMLLHPEDIRLIISKPVKDREKIYKNLQKQFKQQKRKDEKNKEKEKKEGQTWIGFLKKNNPQNEKIMNKFVKVYIPEYYPNHNIIAVFNIDEDKIGIDLRPKNILIPRPTREFEKQLGCDLFTDSCVENFRNLDQDTQKITTEFFPIKDVVLKENLINTIYGLTTLFGKNILFPILEELNAFFDPLYMISGTAAMNHWIQNLGGSFYGYPVIPTQDFDIKMAESSEAENLVKKVIEKSNKNKNAFIKQFNESKNYLKIKDLNFKIGTNNLLIMARINIPELRAYMEKTFGIKRFWFSYPLVDVDILNDEVLRNNRILLPSNVYFASAKYIKEDNYKTWGQIYKNKRRKAKYLYWNIVFPLGHRLHQPTPFGENPVKK